MIHLAALMGLLALTHIICLAAMTERKYSIKKTVLIYAVFGAFFIGLSLAAFILLSSSSVYMVAISFSSTILMGFFVFVLTSADPFCKKLFLFISYSNLFCIFFCIAALVCGALLPALSDTGAMYARNIMRTLLYIPAVFAYFRFLRSYVRAVPGGKKRTWYSVSMVSALFLVVFALFLTAVFARYDQSGEYVFLFAAVVLLYCSVLWVIFGTIRNIIDESKMELISKNVEYLQGQLALARENELAAKAIRHDFRHHNQNIAVLLQKGDVKEALCYIEQYNESLDAARPKDFCPHVTVNAILSNFFIRAQKDGISVSMSADTPRESAIADMDFVAILSNLLENALNGCRECGSNGEIRVNIRTVEDKTVIVCSSPCKSDLVIEDDMIKSKGTGIDSILLAARKYDGDIRYKLGDGRLTACIILNA